MAKLDIKNFNITGLYDNELEGITQEKVIELLSITGDEAKNLFFLGIGSNRVFVIPDRNLEIKFESNRLIVNNKTEGNDNPEFIIETFIKLQGLIEESELKAYGFNLDINATADNEIDWNKFLNNDFLKNINATDTLINASIKIKKHLPDDVISVLELIPSEEKNVIGVHLNRHFNLSELKKMEIIVSDFLSFIKESMVDTDKLLTLK
ncbi:MAG: hypothetical protein WC460_06100 [Patescibacteria group bacterium]